MADSPLLRAMARLQISASASGRDPEVDRLLRELRMAEGDLADAMDAVESAVDDTARLIALKRQNRATEDAERICGTLGHLLEKPVF
ncbi:MAG: hypothetical protein IT353_14875 [Gemmatimonadaceae bacterium]|nr:hypothetical protein [Gemmatimonadaceae bacterium]